MSEITDTAVQPMPIPNRLPAVWDLVLADIRARDEYGARKYHTRLQPHNGRDYLKDAYDEALDLVVYLRGCIYERDGDVGMPRISPETRHSESVCAGGCNGSPDACRCAGERRNANTGVSDD